MGDVEAYLKATGYRVFCFNIGALEKSFWPDPIKAAEQLEGFLEELWVKGELSEKDLRNLAIVGHSMGGLIAKAFAAAYPSLVRCVITVATPHSGVDPELIVLIETASIPLFPFWPILERFDETFSPDSPLLQDLNFAFISSGVKALFVGSPEDWLVPLESALNEGINSSGWKRKVIGGSHSDVARAPGTLRATYSFLERA